MCECLSLMRRGIVTLFVSMAAWGSMVALFSVVAKTIAAEARVDGGAIVLIIAVVKRGMLLRGIAIASYAYVALEMAAMLMS